jgi:hypothetical protein
VADTLAGGAKTHERERDEMKQNFRIAEIVQ